MAASPCPHCDGLGICTFCGGNGLVIVGRTAADCEMCDGTALCITCDGEGIVDDVAV